MQSNANRRSYGTGSLFVYHGAWYGQWRVGGRVVKRKIGVKREPGGRDGLTRTQAESRLRRLIDEIRHAPPERRMAIVDLGASYLHHIEHVMQRKPSTIQDYRCMLNAHLIPYFGKRDVSRITPDDFAGYMRAKRDLAPKTISNHLNFAHGLFAYAADHGWVTSNPVAAVKRPRQLGTDPDLRFLEVVELDALLRSIPDDELGAVELPLYLTAALTGLRQGELIALRWRDVDWTAGLVRVRRSITRGKLGTPKSKRSSRAVPMADRVWGWQKTRSSSPWNTERLKWRSSSAATRSAIGTARLDRFDFGVPSLPRVMLRRTRTRPAIQSTSRQRNAISSPCRSPVSAAER